MKAQCGRNPIDTKNINWAEGIVNVQAFDRHCQQNCLFFACIQDFQRRKKDGKENVNHAMLIANDICLERSTSLLFPLEGDKYFSKQKRLYYHTI